MKNQRQPQGPNSWALRLMGLMAENLDLRSEELNQAYRDCISTLNKDLTRQRRKRLRVVGKKR